MNLSVVRELALQYSLKLSYQFSRTPVRLLVAAGCEGAAADGGGRSAAEATLDYKNPTAYRRPSGRAGYARLALDAMGVTRGTSRLFAAAPTRSPARASGSRDVTVYGCTYSSGQDRECHAEASATFFPGRSFAFNTIQYRPVYYWDRTPMTA